MRSLAVFSFCFIVLRGTYLHDDITLSVSSLKCQLQKSRACFVTARATVSRSAAGSCTTYFLPKEQTINSQPYWHAFLLLCYCWTQKQKNNSNKKESLGPISFLFFLRQSMVDMHIHTASTHPFLFFPQTSRILKFYFEELKCPSVRSQTECLICYLKSSTNSWY